MRCIDLPRILVALYTIQADDYDDELSYVLAPGRSEVLDPVFHKTPISLAGPYGMIFNDDGEVKLLPPAVSHFVIYNSRARSVIYLLLVSQHSDLLDKERAVALSIPIDADKSAEFSLKLLENLWAIQYTLATGKDRPKGDLKTPSRRLPSNRLSRKT